jgi:hypothetical protein
MNLASAQLIRFSQTSGGAGENIRRRVSLFGGSAAPIITAGSAKRKQHQRLPRRFLIACRPALVGISNSSKSSRNPETRQGETGKIARRIAVSRSSIADDRRHLQIEIAAKSGSKAALPSEPTSRVMS